MRATPPHSQRVFMQQRPLVVSGALLATVWADVPVVNSLDFRVTPQRVQVSKTFGF